MVSQLKNSAFKFATLACVLVLLAAATETRAQEGPIPSPAKPEIATPTAEQQQAIRDQIAKFTRRRAKSQKYLLAYKMEKGETVRWKHDHGIVNKSRFGGTSEKTSTRTQPEYSWKVQNVDGRGNMRFEITLDRVQVFSIIGDEAETHYDSDRDAEAPDSCKKYAERVGRPSATYTISSSGQVVDSKSNYRANDMGGVGDAGDTPVIAFPTNPISVGHKWNVNKTLPARDEYGVVKQINMRVQYTLEKVVDGKAYIAFETDVLTPLSSEKVRSQLITHMIKGLAVFDINRGSIVQREIRWDEKVQGYNTPDSFLHYQAMRTEQRVFPAEVAKKAATPAAPTTAAPVARIAKNETPSTPTEKTHTLLQPMGSKSNSEKK